MNAKRFTFRILHEQAKRADLGKLLTGRIIPIPHRYDNPFTIQEETGIRLPTVKSFRLGSLDKKPPKRPTRRHRAMFPTLPAKKVTLRLPSNDDNIAIRNDLSNTSMLTSLLKDGSFNDMGIVLGALGHYSKVKNAINDLDYLNGVDDDNDDDSMAETLETGLDGENDLGMNLGIASRPPHAEPLDTGAMEDDDDNDDDDYVDADDDVDEDEDEGYYWDSDEDENDDVVQHEAPVDENVDVVQHKIPVSENDEDDVQREPLVVSGDPNKQMPLDDGDENEIPQGGPQGGPQDQTTPMRKQPGDVRKLAEQIHQTAPDIEASVEESKKEIELQQFATDSANFLIEFKNKRKWRVQDLAGINADGRQLYNDVELAVETIQKGGSGLQKFYPYVMAVKDVAEFMMHATRLQQGKKATFDIKVDRAIDAYKIISPPYK